ncbi:MAG: tetratricopeptide repeat protein [Anaerolineae bacterium]|nr:tetratricopeptide repeat protein [Anaerolineae bacterium]
MYIRPRKRRQSNPWRILIYLLLIAAGIYVFFSTQQQEIESPFVPTPTPTRSAYSYRTEAETLYIEGDIDGATAVYRQALQLDPQDVNNYIPLVRLLALQGWVDADLAEEAVELGEAAVALAPEHAPAWAVLGMAYDWKGRLSNSLSACLRAIELDPAYAEAYAYLAEAYADSGQWYEAQQAVATALNLASRSVDANRAYGYVLESMGNWSGAVEAYRAALDIHPNLPHLHMDLGRNYLYHLSDTASAIDAFSRAAELDPGRPDALDQLGWTYYAIEDYEMAQLYLERAIEANPDYAPAYAHLATIYWDRRNYEDAAPNFERAIDLAYQATRVNAQGFYVTVEAVAEDYPQPRGSVVMSGELTVDEGEEPRMEALLEPELFNDRWAGASGTLTMDTLSGDYTLSLQGLPLLSMEQTYVGWFEGLDGLDGRPMSTGPFRTRAQGSVELERVAAPVAGPRIEHLYVLGLCYFYMARCEDAYPLFEAALLLDPEDVNALEGIRLCREAEATPTPTP